jgi:hypothetical protein
MNDNASREYREDLFQWIWQNLEFDCTDLNTVCGKPLNIIQQGTINHGAGPDFTGAHILAEGLDWHGSVEIHKTASGWFRHRHQTDEHFNSVVLHVVFEEVNLKNVFTENGAVPLTLCLKPYLHKSLHQLIEMKQSRGIACGKNITFVNQQAFEKQIERAHREYFDYKAEEILKGYPPSLPVSAAWKQAFTVQIYKTLGIPANREQMGELARRVFAEKAMPVSEESFYRLVKKLAFENEGDPIGWKESGMRPASRPLPRTGQAAAFHHAIMRMSLRDFLDHPATSWKKLMNRIPEGKKPGYSRLNLIQYTVCLPALYLLGKLLQSNKLMTETYRIWNENSQVVPGEVVRPFRKAGFEVNRAVKRLGLAHQYKRYCRDRNCNRCEVFKNAIRS